MIERVQWVGVKSNGKWVRDVRKDGHPIWGRTPFKFYDTPDVKEAVCDWADKHIGYGNYTLESV